VKFSRHRWFTNMCYATFSGSENSIVDDRPYDESDTSTGQIN